MNYSLQPKAYLKNKWNCFAGIFQVGFKLVKSVVSDIQA